MSCLEFDYRLSLGFSAPVKNHSFVLRCLPLYDDSQKSDGIRFEVAPYGRLWREGRTLMGDVGFAHEKFDVRVSGRTYEREGADGGRPHPVYSFFTRSTAPDRELKNIAAALSSRRKDYLLAVEVMGLVHSLLKYEPGVTGADTSAAEALSLGKGVCQDYAHIFCSIMRQLGVPTRYVAGLNYGCGATHAWNECYLSGVWRAFDCTNNKPATDGYVKFCTGVDAEECALNRGVFIPAYAGEVTQTQTVEAEVGYALLS